MFSVCLGVRHCFLCCALLNVNWFAYIRLSSFLSVVVHYGSIGCALTLVLLCNT